MTARPTLLSLLTVLASTPSLLAAPTGEAPVVLPGGPYVAECTGHYTYVPVDGSASFDPDGTEVTYQWFEECEYGWFEESTSAQAVFVLETPGPCGHVCTHIELRVTSGGVTSRQRITIAVEDTTAPALQVPPNQVAIWGVPLSPFDMGMASATDACGGEPVLNWIDYRAPGEPCSGIEELIEREWFASDACGNFSQGTQKIWLLSPSGGCSGTPPTNLEIDPTVCENTLDPSSRAGFFRVHLLSRGAFDVAQVDPSSVRLFRLDRPTLRAQPFRPQRAHLGDWIQATAQRFEACSPLGKDGRLDLGLRFVRGKLIDTLGLAELEPGTRVTLILAGRTKSGVTFWAGDDLVITGEAGSQP